MSWLLPSAVAIGGVAAIVVVALHFIARSRPLAEPLPTARFIPQRPIHARTRSIALSDLLLMLLRVGAVLAIGFAVAGPVFAAGRGRVARVVVVDRSRSVANIAALRDSAHAVLRPGDALIVFDSAAQMGNSQTLDSLRQINTRGSLSTALVAATRAGAVAANRADSIELVVLSPFSAEEIDEATLRIRAAWPGVIRVIRVIGVQAATSTGQQPARVQSPSGPSDAVIAGLSLAGVMSTSAAAPVRLLRTRVSPADSAWARDSGHVLIHWPMADSTAIWPKRASIDAIGGATSDGGTIVGRFPRLWAIDGQAIARWADGHPAATEHAVGAGCIRDIGLLIDPASDLTLGAPFRRFVAPFLAPCGGARNTTPVDNGVLATLAGRGALAAGAALRDRASESSRWMPWLLALGALLLIVELAVRRTVPRVDV